LVVAVAALAAGAAVARETEAEMEAVVALGLATAAAWAARAGREVEVEAELFQVGTVAAKEKQFVDTRMTGMCRSFRRLRHRSSLTKIDKTSLH
jgi:hypothetical protein